MAYGDFKDLNSRTAADKAFNIAKNKKKMMDINVELLQWLINILIRKLPVQKLKMKLCLMKN